MSKLVFLSQSFSVYGGQWLEAFDVLLDTYAHMVLLLLAFLVLCAVALGFAERRQKRRLPTTRRRQHPDGFERLTTKPPPLV